MGKRIYAVAGSFAMRKGLEKGIHVYQYDENLAEFQWLGDSFTDRNVGSQCYSKKNDTLYLVHEWRDRVGELGGGGNILAVKVDSQDGSVRLLNETDTGSPQPCFLCMSAKEEYLMAVHHGSDSVVTKLIRREDGKTEIQTISDDCAVELFDVQEDGRIGNLQDVKVHTARRDDTGRIRNIAHLHSCKISPDGKLCLICDKGFDQIHSYYVDEEKGELTLLCETEVEEKSHPRYGVFHPAVSVYYQNNENRAYINVWNYESESGKLNRLQCLPLLFDEEKATSWMQEGASDIVISADGRSLYVSLRGLNLICVFSVDGQGCLKLIQNIDCQGKNPRGLCLSPDERYLFVMNRDSNSIARFLIGQDGTLEHVPGDVECHAPGNMQFIVYQGAIW